ncbi:hypothetical protein Mkiyose1665_53040 [Mycobacterium kiyosense]|jgi:hypothetical protein|nr:hypothetical protein MKCMC460_60460 [Mycobacterium sp. 20KCMC460]GLB92650.1 hypothetical protein SRL2020130_54670 [Mycobacterium kiyosense]GLB98707.1 hypothetical protein SRL2020226_54830 [Mycobacterium kiyosense]GLC04663.1 hypothetical protein SRL2020400_52540 [Mycobacterium kiyosense]GLC16778.1 hypothetical protein SRL2020448_53810 [Mycobacterium kiyosense]
MFTLKRPCWGVGTELVSLLKWSATPRAGNEIEDDLIGTTDSGAEAWRAQYYCQSLAALGKKKRSDHER